MSMEQRPASQKVPAGLAGVLNAPEDNRDSAYFSSTDASSKHTSAASGFKFNGVLSPPGSGFQTSPIDKTPSPTAGSNLLPQPLVSPINSNMSVASMVSPTTPGSADPHRYNRPQSLDSAPNSATFGDMPEALSRRESVDSRINQGFNDMRLGNSPYASHNHSTTSIHNTLQQHRNPRAGIESLSIHRISNGYQPSAERNPEGHVKTMRVAPAITGPATSQIARAAEPTKGQAWAFPEEEIQKVPSAASQSLIDSRRSSFADSLASSQYTTDARLPPGQRRLDDGVNDYPPRISGPSGEYSTLSTVHHHTLQHKQLHDLQNEEVGPHSGGQPYSRTPELRVSHKLAERKRRTEMKELFEQLRDLMPQERGSKASKWEILTKAITEHQRQESHIRSLSNALQHATQELAAVKSELDRYRAHGPPPPPPSGMNDPYHQDHYGRPRGQEPLPPLRALQTPTGPPPPDSMSGIQYEPPRTTGYRPSEPSRY
ncbi:protein esc1 [Echria macrotheca]|uniref:Protein esc1 n=1 Tax=Echria macrotheca TaxID=438768 RepID=A0AAJ0BLQ3_9PEZI|nr:protein esc1 [Echria macrotheca]